MNKILVLGIILVLANRCVQDEDLFTEFIELKSGEILILDNRLVSEFDTSYQWTWFNDNSCDDLLMYRLSNSRLPISMENGFMPEFPRNKFQLSVSQHREDDCSIIGMREENLLEKYLIEEQGSLEEAYDEIEFTIKGQSKIDEREFVVLGWSVNHSKPLVDREEVLSVWLIVENQLVKLDYECCCQSCNGFSLRMYNDHLKKIQIQ